MELLTNAYFPLFWPFVSKHRSHMFFFMLCPMYNAQWYSVPSTCYSYVVWNITGDCLLFYKTEDVWHAYHNLKSRINKLGYIFSQF